MGNTGCLCSCLANVFTARRQRKKAGTKANLKDNHKSALEPVLHGNHSLQPIETTVQDLTEIYSTPLSELYMVTSNENTTSGTGRLRKRTKVLFTTKLPTNLLYADERQLKKIFAKRRLGQDQKLKNLCGNVISQDRTRRLVTKQEVAKLRADSTLRSDLALLVRDPFSTLHQIVPGVYLTGAFGLQKEAMQEANIKLVINVTWELQLLKVKGLKTYRVPVEDEPDHRIDVYFDDVADLIEATRRHRRVTVVHCAAGVSRSSTLVLAYLIKYTDMSLIEAFGHARAIRPCIRPNMGFMAQLVEYERKVRGSCSVRMVTVWDKEHKVNVTIPDFYQEECRDLYEWGVKKGLSKRSLSIKKAFV